MSLTSITRRLLRNAAGDLYEHHADDHEALTRACPVCHAPIGAWCGGRDDVHTERIQPGDDEGARRRHHRALLEAAITAAGDGPDLAT